MFNDETWLDKLPSELTQGDKGNGRWYVFISTARIILACEISARAAHSLKKNVTNASDILNLLSIPQAGGEIVKTFRWKHRL